MSYDKHDSPKVAEIEGALDESIRLLGSVDGANLDTTGADAFTLTSSLERSVIIGLLQRIDNKLADLLERT